MGILEDVLKALERVPGWKRISGLPNEVDELKRRIAALEERIASATGQKCPKCGAMSYRLTSSSPDDDDFVGSGLMVDQYTCSSCSYTNTVRRA